MEQDKLNVVMNNLNGMNEYKIDWNIYSGEYNPYALFGRRPAQWWHSLFPWSHRWEHIASYKTEDECVEHYRKLIGLPVILVPERVSALTRGTSPSGGSSSISAEETLRRERAKNIGQGDGSGNNG
jgi:hypothetical protein